MAPHTCSLLSPQGAHRRIGIYSQDTAFTWLDVYPGSGSLAWAYLPPTDPATVTILLDDASKFAEGAWCAAAATTC